MGFIITFSCMYTIYFGLYSALFTLSSPPIPVGSLLFQFVPLLCSYLIFMTQYISSELPVSICVTGYLFQEHSRQLP